MHAHRLWLHGLREAGTVWKRICTDDRAVLWRHNERVRAFCCADGCALARRDGRAVREARVDREILLKVRPRKSFLLLHGAMAHGR
jgi:hypothetical protein